MLKFITLYHIIVNGTCNCSRMGQ